MAARYNVLFLGGSGFVGGTVLDQVLSSRAATNFRVTILTRSEGIAAKFNALNLGLHTVVGSPEDAELLEELASEADVVFQFARVHLPTIIAAVLTGLKKRYNKTGFPPRFFYPAILLSDDAKGLHGEQTVYSDLDTAVFFDPPNPFVNAFKFVSAALVEADDEGYIKSYLITPPFVFGEPDNIFVKAGIQTNCCSLWPLVIEPALVREKAGYIGEGANYGGAVHVQDLANLFVLLLGNETSVGHGKNGFYYASPVEYRQKELAQIVGQELVALGKAKDATPSRYTDEEVKQFLMLPMIVLFGSNARTSGERSASAGWIPEKSTKEDFFANAREETKRHAREKEKAN